MNKFFKVLNVVNEIVILILVLVFIVSSFFVDLTETHYLRFISMGIMYLIIKTRNNIMK